MCFQEHSSFSRDFSTVILCFHRHSRFVRRILRVAESGSRRVEESNSQEVECHETTVSPDQLARPHSPVFPNSPFPTPDSQFLTPDSCLLLLIILAYHPCLSRDTKSTPKIEIRLETRNLKFETRNYLRFLPTNANLIRSSKSRI